MTHTQTIFAFAVSALAVFSGCGKQPVPADLPALYETTLTFKQDGIPLAGATVMLLSEDATASRWIPTGITDGTGKVVLRTSGTYDGVPAGKYVITVRKQQTEPSKFKEPADTASPEYDQWMKNTENEKLATRRYVDKKYESRAASDLKIDISSGSNNQEYDLGKPVDEIVK